MKNKNLFILLFSFLVVVAFAKNKPESDLVGLDQKVGVQEGQDKVSVEGKEGEKQEPDKEKVTVQEKEHPKAQVDNKIIEEVKQESEAQVENKATENKPEIFLIDKIETVIYGPEETSIITKTDLERTGLDGQQRTKEKMTFELLVYQDAKKYGISDEKLVDKYIEAIQAQQNLSIAAIKKMFADFGYTYEEGREQLGMYNTINQLMDYKVRSKVIIPEKEVREYYDANPAYIEEAYNLQRIFVPVKGDMDAAQQEKYLEQEKKNIESKLRASKVIEGAEYSENFWVEKPELADDKLFISSMSVGSVSAPVFIDGTGEAAAGATAVAAERGFEIFKLVERRERQLASFEQRYREITDLLREPLYNKLFDEYKESLFKDSVVIDL